MQLKRMNIFLNVMKYNLKRFFFLHQDFSQSKIIIRDAYKLVFYT